MNNGESREDRRRSKRENKKRSTVIVGGGRISGRYRKNGMKVKSELYIAFGKWLHVNCTLCIRMETCATITFTQKVKVTF